MKGVLKYSNETRPTQMKLVSWRMSQKPQPLTHVVSAGAVCTQTLKNIRLLKTKLTKPFAGRERSEKTEEKTLHVQQPKYLSFKILLTLGKLRFVKLGFSVKFMS
jgi:hypothetical protein